ncbi:E3 ubiquitin-protein ligase TRIM11-like [Conger conger]|uniref:E3 ubiquitin-protein ligase TRIM11-like n=1 Tax=Conger conger TaxID=82655 RepID=UPI002A5A954A|nr:E3 ubiquitin-protein ligase TRIM11-like [Conger conger]
MASPATNLEAELSCSVCLSTYRDPVLLPCGHNFCRECLCMAWESQDTGKRYSCPECRAEFKELPVLQRNIKLANIVEHFQVVRESVLYSQESAVAMSGQGGDGGHREALGIQPLVADCPEHGRPWEYYCPQDKALLCQSCWESHRDHRCQLLNKAAPQMRAVLIGEVERLEQSQRALEEAVRWLQDAQEHVVADRSILKKQVSGLFHIMHEMISADEQGIMDFIDGEKNLQHARLDSYIGEMRSKKDASELLLVEARGLQQNTVPVWEFVTSYQKILGKLLKADTHIQGCTLKKWELDRASVKQIEKEGQTLARRLRNMIKDKLGQRQEILLKLTLPTRSQVWRNTTKIQKSHPQVKLQRAKLTLDPNTAHTNLRLSGDLLSAEWVEERQAFPSHPERFRLHPQVLCSQGFSTGHHIWEVALSGSRRWEVGATCKASNLSWVDTCIAWALRWDGRRLQAFEGHVRQSSFTLSSVLHAPGRMRVCLDCERGTLSFSALEEGEEVIQTTKEEVKKQNLLHTFHIKTTGPVYPGFYLEQCSVSILQNNSSTNVI